MGKLRRWRNACLCTEASPPLSIPVSLVRVWPAPLINPPDKGEVLACEVFRFPPLLDLSHHFFTLHQHTRSNCLAPPITCSLFTLTPDTYTSIFMSADVVISFVP